MNTTDPPCFYGRAEACPCCGAWRQRARELEKLAYLGEHHFPDLTYKAWLEELVPQLRAAEARVRELEGALQGVLRRHPHHSSCCTVDAAGNPVVTPQSCCCEPWEREARAVAERWPRLP